jgi:hypothetical protein
LKGELTVLKKASLLLALVMVLALAVTGVSAASGASIYVIHGIPGDNGFPVDVSVNGNCALPGFKFGDRVGPLNLVGTYSIAVHVPSATPCGGAAAIGPVALTFADGDNKTIIAHLTAAGAPTASVFVNDFSPTGRGSARIIAHHTAAAPEVDVVVARNYYGGGPRIEVPGFANGDQIKTEVRPGDWDVTLELGGPVYGPTVLTLKPFTAYSIYAVGVFPNSFTYLVYPTMGLK